MSVETRQSNDEGKARFLLIREGSHEYAIQMGRGVKIYGDEDTATVSVGTYADNYEYVELSVDDPKAVAPEGDAFSLVEKLTMRFTAAAERGTNVDLRFCSGDEQLRKPEQDNLRADYPAAKPG
jgi:hypothetical protein